MGAKLCFLLVFAFLNLHIANSIEVKIFYETFNENVRQFVTEQLGPLVDRIDDFGDKLDLKIYPYGRTKNPTDGLYECQNGETQCIANNVHSCSMLASQEGGQHPEERKLDEEKYNVKNVLQFVRCFFKNRFASNEYEVLAEDCAGRSSIDIVSIQACYKNKDTVKMNNIFLASKTDSVKDQIEKSGLVVKIEGATDEEMPNAEKDLLGEVCRRLYDTTVEACKSGTDKLKKLKLTVFYEANNQQTGKYFNKQLFPLYHVLEDFVDLELIPYGDMKYDIDNNVCDENGKSNCLSNIFQAMVIDKYITKKLDGDLVSGPNRAVDFMNCLFHQDTSANVFNALNACSTDNLEVDEYESILGKMKEKNPELKDVMSRMKDATDKVKGKDGKMIRLPYVQLDGIESINSFNNLVQEACTKYTGPKKPSICLKVSVDVLYEVLDHKTRTIFLQELKPIFDNLQSFIDFNFVPAGSIQIDTKEKKICSTDRCNAVKYQACIVDNYWNDGANYTDPIRQEVFESILCIFKNKNTLSISDNVLSCSEIIEADVGFEILDCFKEQGDSKLGENIKDTNGILELAGKPIADAEFPAFVYNRKEVLTPKMLKEKICGQFDPYHAPNYCLEDAPKKVKLRVFYQSDSELSKYFFTTQYDPWYVYLEEMIDVDLIPGGDSANYDQPITGVCESNGTDSVCVANKIQAFVIDEYAKNPNAFDWMDGTRRTTHFLRCVFSHDKWNIDYHEASRDCAIRHLLPDEGVDLIPNAIADTTIYKKDLEDTKAYLQTIGKGAFELLPWITLQTDSGAELHRKRLANDLLQSVCGYYQGDKPPECTPVNVEVYYSGFHPQSRRFFVDELVPVFRNLRERIHLDLIPFGTLKNEDVDCKTSACKVNMRHACVIKEFLNDEDQEKTIQWDGKNQTLTYIHCMFKNVHNYEVEELSEKCANQYIIAETVQECAMGPDGIAALKDMRQKTANLFQPMEHAPWVVINGKPVIGAQTDLRKEICSQIIGDLPEYCLGPKDKKIALQFHYSSLDENSKHYVVKELYENYRTLEEIMDLDLVCLGECDPIDISNHQVVQCPNHQEEAHATLIHACVNELFWRNDENIDSDRVADNEYDGKIQVIEFLKCYFESKEYPDKPLEAAEQCAEDIFLDSWRTIDECAKNGTGFAALKSYQKDKVGLLKPAMKYVPWITINGVHNYAVENHIKRTVCDAYKGREKPLNCYDDLPEVVKPEVFIHYEVDDSKTASFFTKYLIPENVNGLSVVRLVPFGRSTYNEKDKTFSCVNDKECHKYREHACLIDLFLHSKPIETMKTIACTFKPENINNANNVNDCVNQELGEDDIEVIFSCAKDLEKSNKLLKNAYDLVSGMPKTISHSPWIVIDEEHNLEAEVNLPDELCSEYYPADKPAECQIKLLPVGVYYQTRDKGTTDFFGQQLTQQIQYLNEIAEFDFVPFGKTVINSDNTLKCDGGDDQCRANMIHACAVNHVDKYPDDRPSNMIRLGEFFECVSISIESYRKHLRARDLSIEEMCGNRAFSNDIWLEFHECAHTNQGVELMKKMKEKTEKAGVGSVLPEVIIDGKMPKQRREAFFQVLCNSYDIIRPPLCRTIKDFGVRTSIFFTGNEASQIYFNEQLKPLYFSVAPLISARDDDEQLYRLISADLVPWGNMTYNKDADPKDRFKCTTENECWINRFFACAISAHRNEPRGRLHLMEFAVCFFANPEALQKPADVASICAGNVWVPDPFFDLEFCAKSEQEADHKKLLVMKALTEENEPALKSFPSITFNNNFDQEATNGSLFNALCIRYEGIDIPRACPNAPPEDEVTTPKPSSAISIFASSFVLMIVSLFIITQF